ncbi:uncharacterized protein LOC108910848 [Anoplophora glabripennis]|uniref:uncharacterized protein LOC108910848 n=1 Tax=Anoplophora glabripennis TaxID=217634 RepID=UPI000873DAE5|nr:uncharacterized protein LOC108910848 [Anoplophora glabripennis]
MCIMTMIYTLSHNSHKQFRKYFAPKLLWRLIPGRASAKKKAESVAQIAAESLWGKWMEEKTLEFHKNAIESATRESSDEPHDDSYQDESCSRLETEHDLRV